MAVASLMASSDIIHDLKMNLVFYKGEKSTNTSSKLSLNLYFQKMSESLWQNELIFL